MARPLADKCHGNVVQIYTITTEQSSLGKATPIQVEGGLPESSVETNRLCKQRYIHVTEGKSTIHPLYLNLHSTYSKMTVDLCQKIPEVQGREVEKSVALSFLEVGFVLVPVFQLVYIQHLLIMCACMYTRHNNLHICTYMYYSNVQNKVGTYSLV